MYQGPVRKKYETILRKIIENLNKWWINQVMILEDSLLSHKKEQNTAICSNMDGPRDCHTEWIKSDTERQISYIAYMWNLKKRVQKN